VQSRLTFGFETNGFSSLSPFLSFGDLLRGSPLGAQFTQAGVLFTQAVP
jgi:hypothetical protein